MLQGREPESRGTWQEGKWLELGGAVADPSGKQNPLRRRQADVQVFDGTWP